MPKLWDETMESHRQAVREAIFRAVHTQVHERGLAGVTMSGVAAEAGIGRATLYKYFPDVRSILDAVHEHHIAEHLARLSDVVSADAPVADRLRRVLEEYAEICARRVRHGDPEVTELLHRPEVIIGADQRLLTLFTGVIEEAQREGAVRDDASPRVLATFCLQSLAAGEVGEPGTAKGKTATLVGLTLDGLGVAR